MPARTSLYVVHRLLIWSAIVLSVLLLVHGVALFVARRDVASLTTGVLAAVVGVGLAFYLRRLARKD